MKVYLTYYNSDMTEGRGPMTLDKIFSNKEHAEEYIDSQEGIMGRRYKWSDKIYGDWTVVEKDVIKCSLIDKKAEREKLIKSAKAKLSELELNALGLKP